MSDLYERDIVLWSEQQAALLRRIEAGEAVNERPDWPNLIDEVESVGREQIHAVESLLVQTVLHRLKAQARPHSREARHWPREARGFQSEAAARFTPSMRSRIDMAKIWRRVLVQFPGEIDGQPPETLPDACPWPLDALVAEP